MHSGKRRLVSNRSARLSYGVAGIATLAALGVRFTLDPVLGPYAPYMPFAIAVIVAARFGGRAPGYACTVLSALTSSYFFLEPRYSLAIASPAAGAGLALFVIVGAVISVLVGDLHESLQTLARAEAELRRDTQLIELSHNAIITADANRVITGWNSGAAEMYGWTQGDVAGKSIHDVLQTSVIETGDPISPATIYEILYRKGRWEGELSHIARDGRRLVVESRQVLLRDERNEPAGILEINRDITERKRVEEQLVAEHRKNAAILESISDGFNAFDRDWRYTYVNSAAAKMVGKTPAELLGKVLWELWPEAADSPFGAAYRRAVAENVPVRVEAFYPEPLNRWFEVRCYPSPEGLSLFFSDITERRQAEERLRQTQKLESIGLLAGGVAHDFNNILTVIMGSAGSALMECASCEHAQGILSASQRAAYLTRQLLAYAGKGRTVVKQIDLTELVTQAKKLLSASVAKRVSLSYRLADDLPCLEGDPSRVEQVLMNLVINAGESILPRQDGRIEIATSRHEVSEDIARQHSSGYDVAPGVYVCLEVRDNGCGMDEATAARIFDPFFTTKFSGRGLGLAAVHGIVRTSKGFIDVDSAPGAGTTFRVFLPACGKERTRELPRGTSHQQSEGAGIVLIVEDEDMVRKLARSILRRHGYEVLEATDGHDALRVLAESSTLPAVVLLDLAMPVMGGDELAPILAAKYPGLKIIMSSGYPEDESRQIPMNGSLAGFLQKPYNPIDLVEKIAQVLRG